MTGLCMMRVMEECVAYRVRHLGKINSVSMGFLRKSIILKLWFLCFVLKGRHLEEGRDLSGLVN